MGDKYQIDFMCDVSKLQELYYEVEKNNKRLLLEIQKQINYIIENYSIKKGE